MYAANDLLPVIRVLSHGTQELSERIAQSATDAAEDGCICRLSDKSQNRSQSACLDGVASHSRARNQRSRTGLATGRRQSWVGGASKLRLFIC